MASLAQMLQRMGAGGNSAPQERFININGQRVPIRLIGDDGAGGSFAVGFNEASGRWEPLMHRARRADPAVQRMMGQEPDIVNTTSGVSTFDWGAPETFGNMEFAFGTPQLQQGVQRFMDNQLPGAVFQQGSHLMANIGDDGSSGNSGRMPQEVFLRQTPGSWRVDDFGNNVFDPNTGTRWEQVLDPFGGWGQAFGANMGQRANQRNSFKEMLPAIAMMAPAFMGIMAASAAGAGGVGAGASASAGGTAAGADLGAAMSKAAADMGISSQSVMQGAADSMFAGGGIGAGSGAGAFTPWGAQAGITTGSTAADAAFGLGSITPSGTVLAPTSASFARPTALGGSGKPGMGVAETGTVSKGGIAGTGITASDALQGASLLMSLGGGRGGAGGGADVSVAPDRPGGMRPGDENGPAVQSAIANQRKRLRAAQGRRSTILTGPGNKLGGAAIRRKTILGG